MRHVILAAVMLCAWAGSQPALAQDTEEVAFTESSQSFLAGAENALKALRGSDFLEGLEAPSLGAKSADEFAALLGEINTEKAIAGIALGDAKVVYDVIVQPGHYGRKTGLTGASGALVSERALVAFVAAGVAAELRKRGFSVLVVSADDYIRDDASTPAWDGLSAKSFIAIHADGSVNACSTGPSLGYAEGTSPHAMHAIGLGMAQALGYKYADFMRDNFTANAAKYYMFRQVNASGFKGLLEIGELTCAKDEKMLIEYSTLLATNIAHSIDFIISMPSQ